MLIKSFDAEICESRNWKSKYTSMSYKFYETLERWSKYTHYVTLHIAEIDMDVSIDVSIDYSRFLNISLFFESETIALRNIQLKKRMAHLFYTEHILQRPLINHKLLAELRWTRAVSTSDVSSHVCLNVRRIVVTALGNRVYPIHPLTTMPKPTSKFPSQSLRLFLCYYQGHRGGRSLGQRNLHQLVFVIDSRTRSKIRL